MVVAQKQGEDLVIWHISNGGWVFLPARWMNKLWFVIYSTGLLLHHHPHASLDDVNMTPVPLV